MENLEKLKIQYQDSAEHVAFWVAIEQAWKKAQKYYALSDITPVYAAAVLLDPRQKKEYLVEAWGEEWAEHSIAKIRELYEKDYPATPEETLLSSQSSQGSSHRAPLAELSSNTAGNTPKAPRYHPLLSRLKESRKLPTPEPFTGNEIAHYLSTPRETDDDVVPAQYWRRSAIKALYPRLSRMAIDILSIPAMSSEPERIFSKGGITLSPRRSNMKESTLEGCLCLQNWGNSGLIVIGNHGETLRGGDDADVATQAELLINGGDDDDEIEASRVLFAESWVMGEAS